MVGRSRLAKRNRIRQNAGFSGEELASLEELFGQYDADGSRYISKQELAGAIGKLFPSYARSRQRRPELAQIVQKVDKDRRGALSFSGFLALMRHIREEEEKERLGEEQFLAAQLGFSPM